MARLQLKNILKLPTLVSGLCFLILGFAYIAWALTTSPRLFFHQQYNVTPEARTGRTVTLQLGQSVGQTLTSLTPAKFGGLAVRYLPAPNTETVSLQATLQQNNTTLQEFTGSASEFTQPPAGIFRSEDRYTETLSQLPWLFFPFDTLPASSEDYTFTIQLRGPAAASLTLPYEIDSTGYAAGERLQNGAPAAGDFRFVLFTQPSLDQRLSRLLSTEPHLATLLILLSVSLLIGLVVQISQRVRQGQPWLPAQPLLLWLLLAVLFTLPLFYDMQHWGNEDWPEVVAHFAAARHSLKAGQFPLWNPYFCGGFPAWGNPQTYWPSLTFLIAWLTNDLIGTKLAVILYTFIGLAGMAQLGRAWGLRSPASLAPPIIYMFSGFFVFHISAGHLLWLTLAWIPWLLYFFWKSLRRPTLPNLLPGVLFYLLIFIEGQIYFFVYITLFLIGLGLAIILSGSTQPRRAVALRLLIFFTVAALLGAVKFLPTWALVRDFTGNLDNIAPLSVRYIPTLLFATPESVAGETLPQPWWEMLIYTGYLAVAAALVGAVYVSRQFRKARLLLFAAAGLALLFVFLPTQANPLEWLPVLQHVRSHNRLLLLFILPVSLLAGFGLQLAARRLPKRWREAAVTLVVFMLLLDFFRVAHAPLSRAFSADRLAQEIQPTFAMRSSRQDSAYHTVLSNSGAPQYCPPHLRQWSPATVILNTSDPDYRGEVYSEKGTPVALQSFSPNRLTIHISSVTAPADTIHINQKYASGWRLPDRGVESRDGHLSFSIAPADSETTLTLSYLPRSFVVGASLSGLTAVVLLAVSLHAGWRNRRRV